MRSLRYKWFTSMTVALVLPSLLCACETGPTPAPVLEADSGRIGDTSTVQCEFFKHPELDVCVQCLRDEDCLSGHCEPTSFQCVSCYDDSHCAGGVCLAEQFFCVECTQDSHCGSGLCDVPSRQCVGCGSDNDCDDANSCTKDECFEGRCQYDVLEDQACDVDPCFEEKCSSTAACVSLGVPTEGACEQVCTTSASCGAAEWCKPDKGCDGPGICLVRNDSCTESGLKPVCGCDSATYKSACVAEAAGVAVAYEGACECVGEGCCNGITCCEAPPICTTGQLVDADGDGCEDTCCTAPPVCAAGQPIDTNNDGCPETCPCLSGLDCEVGSVCKTDLCGSLGVCSSCTSQTENSLVCSCAGDEVSLKALCMSPADAAIGPATECCPPPPMCTNGVGLDTSKDGCIDSCTCSTGGCEGTDICGNSSCDSQEVVCLPCLDDTGAVCGCDGTTYSSQCEALQAGTAVLYGGACECATGTPCAAEDQVCDSISCSGDGSGYCVELKTSMATLCGCDGISYKGLLSLKAAGTSFAYTGCCSLKCGSGTYAEDTDGDGCPDSCEVGCKSGLDCGANICLKAGCNSIGACVALNALPGGCVGACSCNGSLLTDGCATDVGLSTLSIDSSGAACAVPCAQVLCTDGKLPIDSDQDGCADICECPATENTCNENEESSQSPDDCSVSCVGASCSSNADCVGDWFCEFSSCGDSVGACTSMEGPCDADSGVVCGCDGSSYPSACAAKAAGVSLAPSGGPLPCALSPMMP